MAGNSRSLLYALNGTAVALAASVVLPGAGAAASDPPRPLQIPPRAPAAPPVTGLRPPPLGRLPKATDAPGSEPLGAYPLPRHGLIRGVSDGHTFILDNDPTLAQTAMGVAASDGARSVRIPVLWSYVERGAPTDQTDPADPAYSFRALDAAVRSAVARGLDPLLAVLQAPARAEAPNRWRYAAPGTWAPRPEALGACATALARWYDGTFPDPLLPGRALPAVHRWQAWNEPNLPAFLQPQWVPRNGHWVAYAPVRYRAMLNAFWTGIHAVQPTAVVATAGLAPLGEARDGEGRMAPVRFLRALLCAPAEPDDAPPPCPDPAHFDAFAFHPLSIRDPGRPARQVLDVAVADLGKLLAVLHGAQRHGRALPAGKRQPLWITELNWDSRPPNPSGATKGEVTRWVSDAMYRLWRMGATLVDWQFLRDPLVIDDGRATHPAGLYRVDAASPASIELDRPKPALRSYRLPFVAERLDGRRVRLWSLLPPETQGAVLERRAASGWAPLAQLAVRPAGFVLQTLVRRGAVRLRVRLPDGTRSASRSVGVVRSVLR